MSAHIVVLAVLGFLRFLGGGVIGGFFLLRGFSIPVGRLARLEHWDRAVFLSVGALWISLSLLRGLQGGLSIAFVLSRRRGGVRAGSAMGRLVRLLGVLLSMVDLCDLIAFPFTTACGTYGLLVNRHPDTVDFYEGVFSAGKG